MADPPRANHYDAVSDAYAAAVAERERAVDGDPFGILAPLLDLLGEVAGQAVLDAGCTTARCRSTSTRSSIRACGSSGWSTCRGPTRARGCRRAAASRASCSFGSTGQSKEKGGTPKRPA